MLSIALLVVSVQQASGHKHTLNIRQAPFSTQIRQQENSTENNNNKSTSKILNDFILLLLMLIIIGNIAHLNPCHEEMMLTTKNQSQFPTPKSILGITYQVIKFNQNILICTISMSTFNPNKKVRMFMRSNILLHNVLYFFPFHLIYNMAFFRK